MAFARGGSIWPVAVGAAALALAQGCAYAISRTEIAELRFVRAAPRATLDAPRQGPAVYAGSVVGPRGRVDTLGQPAAARWWWVVERVSKSNSKTVCFEREMTSMQLVGDGGKALPLAMFDGTGEISLLGELRDDDWSERLLIDLAGQLPHKPATFPAYAQRCAGDRRTFIGRSIPEGARAEVLACQRAGALVACPTTPSGVLALGGMGRHASRRALRAATPFFFATGFSWAVLFALTVRALRYRRRALGAIVPEEPR